MGSHIEYSIEVANISTGESWKFQRRYSMLRTVYSYAKTIFSVSQSFPPKKVFGNMSPKFLEQRRLGLESYFSDLLKNPEVLENEYCKHFYIPADKVVVSQVPVPRAKPVIPEMKKTSLDNEIREISKKETDNLTSKLFDLSTQPAPLDEEEIRKQAKVYSIICKDLGLAETQRLPSRSDINQTCLTFNVEKQEFLSKSLEKLTRIIPTGPRPFLTKFLD